MHYVFKHQFMISHQINPNVSNAIATPFSFLNIINLAIFLIFFEDGHIAMLFLTALNILTSFSESPNTIKLSLVTLIIEPNFLIKFPFVLPLF